MHDRDVPIVLTRPPNYSPGPRFSLGEPDVVLEAAARNIFSLLGVGSAAFEEPPVPNQYYVWFWSGSKDGIKYEVRRGEGPHAGEYPIWIWVGLETTGRWSDQLSEEAHAAAAKLAECGYRCTVRGYISATGEAPL
jgi:hypothetical protein